MQIEHRGGLLIEQFCKSKFANYRKTRNS